MRKEIVTLNTNGGVCTATLLAHIAVLLETHGHVKVVNVGRSASGAAAFHVVGGISARRSIFTIDLIPLNPYFHGTTSRTGAPS